MYVKYTNHHPENGYMLLEKTIYAVFPTILISLFILYKIFKMDSISYFTFAFQSYGTGVEYQHLYVLAYSNNRDKYKLADFFYK